MKRLITVVTFLFIMLSISGCGLFQKVVYVPVEAKKDSIVVEKIVERVDTIKVDVPNEVVVFSAPVDSSHLETGVAISDAWVDSSAVLHHILKNKKVSLEKEIVYRDSIKEVFVNVDKEIPVEVKVDVPYVPKYYKIINIILWSLVGLFVIFIVLKFYFKL